MYNCCVSYNLWYRNNIWDCKGRDRQITDRFLIKILDYCLRRAKTGATSRIPFPAIFFLNKSKNSKSLGKVHQTSVLLNRWYFYFWFAWTCLWTVMYVQNITQWALPHQQSTSLPPFEQLTYRSYHRDQWIWRLNVLHKILNGRWNLRTVYKKNQWIWCPDVLHKILNGRWKSWNCFKKTFLRYIERFLAFWTF
jgi:hypothetical protein